MLWASKKWAAPASSPSASGAAISQTSADDELLTMGVLDLEPGATIPGDGAAATDSAHSSSPTTGTAR